MQIPLDLIDLPEHDLRATVDDDAIDELADSLRDVGQLQAIAVRPKPDGRFEVVFGARRTRAARSIEWTDIRAEIFEDDGEQRTAAKKLIENVQRQDLTPIEEGYGLFALIGEGDANIRTLQKQTGKSRDWIKSRLELVQLPEDLQAAVQNGDIGVQVAKHLGTIQHDEIRAQYLAHATENGCTADQAKLWAANAQYAEAGLASMQLSEADFERLQTEPQVVEQKYHCFVCAAEKSWRQVNTLVMCGPCQDKISDNRRANYPRELADPPRSP